MGREKVLYRLLSFFVGFSMMVLYFACAYIDEAFALGRLR